jgi:hypothetical protein
MRLQPKGASCGGSIDTDLAPPSSFIAATMHFAMMSAALASPATAGGGRSDGAALWAQQRLAAKNTLSAADAEHLEQAFQSKLATV